EVPVMTWNYKSQDPSIRHAGPTAQDFRAAFGLGESELMINTVDIDGINLAAVKALEARTRELAEATAEIEELRAELAAHKRRIEALERRQKEILGRLGRIESRR
ncbi:MAG TPA: tail fiber domain-containing protein, partial [Longimicrobiales bacterium]